MARMPQALRILAVAEFWGCDNSAKKSGPDLGGVGWGACEAGTVLLGKSDVFFYDSLRALANCQN
jgi:hypothetical protein